MSVSLSKCIPLLVLIGLLLILTGCSRDKQGEDAGKSETGSAEQLDKAAAGLSDPEVISITGEVLEVVDSGSFVFILLDRGDERIWATVPAVKVEVGEKVTLLDANVFSKFHSKELDRTFEELIFSTGIEGKTEVSSAGFGRGMAGDKANRLTDRR
ncbi:MAG: hypothetical protein ABR605_04830 [Desulfurivibrionaceae bacterium]